MRLDSEVRVSVVVSSEAMWATVDTAVKSIWVDKV